MGVEMREEDECPKDGRKVTPWDIALPVQALEALVELGPGASGGSGGLGEVYGPTSLVVVEDASSCKVTRTLTT